MAIRCDNGPELTSRHFWLAAAAEVIKEHGLDVDENYLATGACFDTKRYPHCRR